MSERPFLHALLHRWFVQYNPLYLLSAVLVLVGLTLVDDGLAHDASAVSHLAVAGITELYAFALIAGAAVLTRLGLRRPAVFVALIAVLYQGDLVLGTESQALFGSAGALATLGWLVVFAAKLHALAWALRLRLSASASAVPLFGATGLALIPHLSRRLDAQALTLTVAAWLFALFAAGLWTTRRVTSRDPLDAWGRTVLRRSLRATWAIWSALALGHVLFWTHQYGLRRDVLAPIALLLATRWIACERRVLASIVVTLGYVATSSPDLFSETALMAAAVLTLHALRKPRNPGDAVSSPPRDHYRGAAIPAQPEPFETSFTPSVGAALIRQLAWAGYALHLAAWTASWSGDAWPAHVVPLDATLALAVALVVWRTRVHVVTAPLLAGALHWGIQARVVRAPQSVLQWGVSCVAAGFGLLLAAVAISVRLSRTRRADQLPHTS